VGGANLVAFDLYKDLRNLEMSICLAPSRSVNRREERILNLQEMELSKLNLAFLLSSNRIVLNSLNHPPHVYNAILQILQHYPNKQLVLWVHEDQPSQFLQSTKELIAIKQILNRRDQVKLATPSIGTARSLSNYFNYPNSEIQLFTYPLEIPNNLVEIATNTFQNLDTIRFYISARTFDSRKNHRLILNIFEQVNRSRTQNHRMFKLIFIGVSEDQYSTKLVAKAGELLKEKFEHHGVLAVSKAQKIMATCHVAINVSKFETLPRYITEALALGQLILRNTSSGIEEQLIDGSNGYVIDEQNVEEAARKILMILDKTQHPAERIMLMRKSSFNIYRDIQNAYSLQRSQILDFFNVE
jgi:glycosyltransferase involved in cell wall biosynthesis